MALLCGIPAVSARAYPSRYPHRSSVSGDEFADTLPRAGACRSDGIGRLDVQKVKAGEHSPVLGTRSRRLSRSRNSVGRIQVEQRLGRS